MRSLPQPTTGALFVLSGPSGVGKSTLLRGVLDEIPGLSFSVSATTRDPRPGEIDGRDYHFVTRGRFAKMVEQGAFLEHAGVYDNAYGTPSEPVDRAMSVGKSILLDIDVQGARQVRGQRPSAVLIMVVPPDVTTLKRRLLKRHTETDAVITARMAKVGEQLGAVDEYDYLVVNDDLTTARRQLQSVFLAELSRVARHAARVAGIRAELASRDA